MTKEKQIEEMSAEIREAVNGCSSYWSGLIANALYEAGYRKQRERYLLKENGDITLLPRQSEGEWIKELIYSRNNDDFFRYTCSKCGRDYEEQANFCPNCGSKMKGGGE